MKFRALKYLSLVAIYILALVSFLSHGWLTWLPLIYACINLPICELLIQPDDSNLGAAEEELARKDRTYDFLLYGFVVLQFGALLVFLHSFGQTMPDNPTVAGRIGTMGLLCGTFGINIGHELGHRSTRYEQWLAKAALMSSLYMHFFIEHNRGHHRNVATPNNPNSARYNEPVFLFYFRTIFYSYLSALRRK